MRKNWLLLTLLLTGLAGISYADLKFFWLDRPTSRDNPHDPASPNYVASTPTAGGGGGGSTATDTRTVTPTPSDTPGAGPTNTPTQVTTPSCVTVTKNITLLDFESGQYSGDWGWSGVTSGTQLTLASPLTRTGNCSAQGYQVMVSTALTTGQSSGVDVNFNPLTAVDVSTATTFKMAILAPQGMNGTVFLSDVSGGSATFKISSGSFSVPASPNWQLVSIPASSFTVTVGGSGAWTPTAGNAVNDFTLEVDGPTAVQMLGVDDVGFVTGAAPTATPTPTTGTGGPWPIIYNGEAAAPLGGNFYAAGGSAGAVDTAGAGAGGSAHYADVTMSCVAAGYAAVGAFATGFDMVGNPLTQTVAAGSGYTALSISVEVASGAVDSCVVPEISLVTKNGTQKTSAPVSMETYLVGGPQFMTAGIWYTAVIPISAFSYGTDGSGFNGKASPNSDTITAADLSMLTAVQVEPSYQADGSVNTELYVDDIVFNNATPALDSAGITPLFCDFEHGTASNWGDYWSSFTDQDKPDFTCTSVTQNSSRVFPTCGNCPNAVPVVTPPVTSGVGGPATPCDFGRIAGHVGDANPGTTCSLNAPAGNYSYFGMGVFFLLSHGPADILSLIGSYFPSNGNRPHGIQVDIKSGPNAAAGQTYTMFITLDNFTCGGCDAGTDLAPTSSWTTVQVPFPANGTVLTSVPSANGAFAQPSWAGSALTWDASGTSTDTLKHFQQLKFQADKRGVNIDLEVDNIKFY